MQVFYGVLVQHFANLAGSKPLPLDHLDVLTVHLLDFTAEVPFYAATVAQARLKRLQQRLSNCLTDPVRFNTLTLSQHVMQWACSKLFG